MSKTWVFLTVFVLWGLYSCLPSGSQFYKGGKNFNAMKQQQEAEQKLQNKPKILDVAHNAPEGALAYLPFGKGKSVTVYEDGISMSGMRVSGRTYIPFREVTSVEELGSVVTVGTGTSGIRLVSPNYRERAELLSLLRKLTDSAHGLN
ncbi:MAG: hypothetical protein J5J00_08155 [Deltaproteobacteria bacterium]|nr:hypothetical protein [Deltaproteobacteria bacterium]